MKSYTTGRNLAGVWTKNTNTSNLSYLDQTANDAYRHLCALKDWSFLEQLRTISTIGNQQFYPAPWDCARVKEISVLVNNITYTPKLSPSREHWDQLNLSKFTSDIPEWYFIFGGNSGAGMRIGLWPTPASSGNTINVTQKCRVVDLQFADYTTGTITTAASASGLTTVTGSGTSWTAGQAGLWMQITPTAASSAGDGQWYLVTGVTNSTTLVLANQYSADFSGASANYILAQMPLLPEDFHDTPWKRAAQGYWGKESDDEGRYDKFKAAADKDEGDLIRTWSAPGGDFVIDTGDDPQIINPNLVIRL